MNELENALSQIELPDDPELVALIDLDWSDYQLAIFEFVKSGTGNAVVKALAGSGKTSSILGALNYTDPSIRVAFVAFNKRIADELRNRSPDHVYVSTLHSLGLRNIKRAFPKTKVEKSKMWKLLDQYRSSLAFRDRDKLKENLAAIMKLVSMLKATLLEPTEVNMDFIVDHYNLNVNSQSEFIYSAVESLWNMSRDTIEEMVDFDDMIYAPGAGLVECEKFDFLFVDEAQDLNKAQIQFVLNSVARNGRVVAVGDEFQAIYGFAGSDTESIPNLIHALDATILPLSITYRCPLRVVELAQAFVPHLEAREDAPEGIVKTIREPELLGLVEESDLVICRTNAPLVAPAFGLIRNGVKAVILGREIGRGLIGLIDRVGKRNNPYDVVELLGYMRTYINNEIRKLIVARKTSRALALQDQFDTIIALADGCREISEIKSKINRVFDDNRKGVTFSSIHKIKGGEAERVFILRPDLMPHPMAVDSAWQMEQEKNLQYVAISRAKSELYFVIE